MNTEDMTIHEYESAVRSCFGEDGIEELWYGGEEGKRGDDPNKMYVAITEGNEWWLNKCVLRDWYFDYEKFKTLPLEFDCAAYGVYVFFFKYAAEKKLISTDGVMSSQR